MANGDVTEAIDGAVVVEDMISCDEVTKSLIKLASERGDMSASAGGVTSLTFCDIMALWRQVEDEMEKVWSIDEPRDWHCLGAMCQWRRLIWSSESLLRSRHEKGRAIEMP